MPVTLRPRQINKLKSTSIRLAAIGAVGAILWSALLPISTFALQNSSNAPAATNKDTNVQASEVASALSKTDGVLEASSQVKTTSDGDSAIKAATAGATIDVPKDASQGVTLGSSNGSAPAIGISIPNADQAKDAKKVANGQLIETYFTTDGQTLTQVVKHNVRGIVYPVTADPRFSWGWSGVTVYFNRNETAFVARAGGAALGVLGLGGVAVGFGVQETASWGASRGYCLAVYKPYWAPFLSSWWVYRC